MKIPFLALLVFIFSYLDMETLPQKERALSAASEALTAPSETLLAAFAAPFETLPPSLVMVIVPYGVQITTKLI